MGVAYVGITGSDHRADRMAEMNSVKRKVWDQLWHQVSALVAKAAKYAVEKRVVRLVSIVGVSGVNYDWMIREQIRKPI